MMRSRPMIVCLAVSALLVAAVLFRTPDVHRSPRANSRLPGTDPEVLTREVLDRKPVGWVFGRMIGLPQERVPGFSPPAPLPTSTASRQSTFHER